MTESVTVHQSLRSDIDSSGYYPDLVADSLTTALGVESLVAYAVHHETTFEREQLRRHITVLALTPTRLVIVHVDEHPPDDDTDAARASASTEAIRLDHISSVAITRIVNHPSTYQSGDVPHELVLTLGWSAVSRIDLEPTECSDQYCDADHGYTGVVVNDDLNLRVSSVVDGHNRLRQFLGFAQALSDATARLR